MSRADKALRKLLDCDQDANWSDLDELDRVLKALGYAAVIKKNTHGRWKHPTHPDANCECCESHKKGGAGGVKKPYICTIRNNVKYLISIDDTLSELRKELGL